MPGYFVRMSIQWLLSMRHAKDKSVTVVSGDPYDRCPYQHGASCHNNCKKLKVEKLSNSRRYGFILIGRNTIIQSPNLRPHWAQIIHTLSYVRSHRSTTDTSVSIFIAHLHISVPYPLLVSIDISQTAIDGTSIEGGR